MIECEHFYDPEAGMKGEGRHNARVTDYPDINATFETMQEVRESLAQTWNDRNPGEPTPADGSAFSFTDVDTY